MRLVKAKNVKKKYERTSDQWAGLNKNALIADNQFSSVTNMSTKNFPLPSPRPSREAVYTLNDGYAIFSNKSYLAWVDNLTFTSAAADITFGAHTITSAASAFSHIAVGDTLTITGCTVNTENNVVCIVTTATAAILTCSATTFTITSGTPAGKETGAITFTGCSFKYNNVTKGAVTASAKSMVDFNGRIGIFPDNKTYDYIDDEFADMQGKCKIVRYGYDAAGDIDYDADTKVRSKNIISILPSTAYTLTNDKAYTVATVCYFDINAQFISKATVNFASFTTLATAYYMHFDITGTDLTVVVTITNAIYPTETAIPDMDFVTTWDNRVWGVAEDGDDIYGSALGDINNWTTYTSPSISTDSYTVDTGSGGYFTGITTYNDTVIAFKEELVKQLYGDIPTNFEFKTVSTLGCIDSKSIRETNNILYYLGRKGTYSYNGGFPSLASYDLNETYSSGKAGADNRYYYMSLYNDSEYNLYVYDTMSSSGIWSREDNLQVKEFTYLDGYIYALANDDVIYKFNSGTERVTMTLISKEYTEDTFSKKITKEIDLRADLEIGSTLAVSKRIDNGSFESVKSGYHTSDLNSVRIPIKIERADHFQVKIEMKGDGILHKLSRIMCVGSRK